MMGGNIFKTTTRINRNYVSSTYNAIVSELDLKDCRLLGSSGKKATSGDLDIAVPSDKNSTIDEIESTIEEKYSIFKRQGNMISFPAPIQGSTGKVQVDLIFGNAEWLSLYYYYDENSKLKGVHRNIAISVLCRYVDSEILDDRLSTNKKPLSYIRYKWSSTQGLVRVHREAVMTRTGKHAKKEKETIIGDPLYSAKDISLVLFGNIKDADKYLHSAESVIEYIEKYMDNAEEILDSIAIEFSNSRIHSDELVYPKSIENRIGKILSGSFIGNVGTKTNTEVQTN